MGINRYIVVSSLFHLLLISLLVIKNPIQNMNLTTFNVRLIEPVGRGQSEPLKEKKRMHILRREKLAESSRPPDRLLGDNTNVNSRGHGVKDTESNPSFNKTEESLPPSVNENPVIESDNDKQKKPQAEITKPEPSKFLFDKETIEKFAKAQSPDNRRFTFDAPEFKHRGYMRMLRQRIESIWVYPQDAIRQGISGDLYIKFSIKRDGGLGDIELIRTSGHRSLDEAAMKAIRDAQPFWPLPGDWQKDELVIDGHFIYILGETVIM